MKTQRVAWFVMWYAHGIRFGQPRLGILNLLRLTFILLILLCWLSVGSTEEGSDPTAMLDEQTKRRHQEELTRVGREQKLHHLQLKQKLSQFDHRLNAARSRIGDGGLDRHERHRLSQRLDQVQQQQARRQSHLEHNLNHLELSERNDDFRQKQELNRLRHRQRSEAFVDRQKIRLRRYIISNPGRK